MRNVLRLAPVIAIDLAGIAGGALVAYGAGLVYVPAGFVVGGLELIAAAWLLSKARI